MTFAEDLQGIGVTRRGAKRVAIDRQRWRNLVTRFSENSESKYHHFGTDF